MIRYLETPTATLVSRRSRPAGRMGASHCCIGDRLANFWSSWREGQNVLLRPTGSRTRDAVTTAALLSCVAFNAGARAATPTPTPSPPRLQTVIVSADRETADALDVPASVQIIEARDIHRAQPGISVAESLRRVPGVAVRERQNEAQDVQLSIRGFGARAAFGVRGLRLYTDGIPATAPDGQGQVSHFAIGQAETIEVLRGPFSALYGSSSGGVIALFSRAPPEQTEISTRSVAGSDGAWRTAIGLGDSTDSGAWGSRIDASRFVTDGYREHSKARRDNGQAEIRVSAPAGEWSFVLNSVDLEADDPQGLTELQLAGDRRAASDGALTFNTRKSARQNQAGLRFSGAPADRFRMRVIAHAGQRDVEQFLSVPVAAQRNPLGGGGVIDLARDYAGLDARVSVDGALLGRDMEFTIGTEAQRSDERRRGYENFAGSSMGVRGVLRRDERNRVQSLDQYLQADWDFADRWRAVVGARHSAVRFDSVDHFIAGLNPDDSGQLRFSKTTPVAGVSFRVRDGLSVFTNIGSGFETPTFNELAYRVDGSSGLNSGLGPARSRNAEAGLRWRSVDHAIDLAAFASRTRGELAVAASSGGRTSFVNAGASRRVGIEMGARGRIREGWRYAFAYTALDATYPDGFRICANPTCVSPTLVAAGSRIPAIARHTAFGEIVHEAGEDFDVSVSAYANSRVFADDRNTASAPGHMVLDLAATRRFDLGGLRIESYARLENLLDREVIGSVIVNESNGRYFEPAPGRGWLLGVNLDLAFD